jgi:DNA-binding MarR family transcriptional regulator/GNAT superfamily N-acetyltransferase
MANDVVEDVRAFNRFYTGIIGVLDEGLVDTPWSLTEARALYELAQADELDVPTLRRTLGVDGGYLSRILHRFEGAGVVERSRSAADARRGVIRLTKAGRRTFADLDRRTAKQIDGLLEGLDDADRRRLVGAMGTVRALLSDGASARPVVVLRSPGPGDLGWIVQRNGALYAAEYGWDETYEALVAGIVTEFATRADTKREAAWIAEVDGERAGCVLCVAHEGGADADVAQLRLLLVEPWARGTGVGGRLVEECLRFARRAGYRRMVLWTNHVLSDARRIYERMGFVLLDEAPKPAFGKDLVSQWWGRDLDDIGG